MSWLLGNPWDWIIIIVLLALAVAIGVKEDDKPVIPQPIVVRSIGVFLLLLVIINIGTFKTLLFG